MEENFNAIEDKLLLKAQRIKQLVLAYQHHAKHKFRLRDRNLDGERSCDIKTQQLLLVRGEISKEEAAIRQVQKRGLAKQFAQPIRRLEQCGRLLTSSLERMTRVEKIVPYILDSHLLRGEQQAGVEKVQLLEQECQSRRAQLKNVCRGRTLDYHNLVEQMQSLTDVHWELSELKKEEEEEEAYKYNQNLSLGRKNVQIKQRTQNRREFSLRR